MKHGESVLSRPGPVALYMQWWLPESAPKASLALVHGLGEHSGRYVNLVKTLTDRGIAVYAADNRGFGKSSVSGRMRFPSPAANRIAFIELRS